MMHKCKACVHVSVLAITVRNSAKLGEVKVLNHFLLCLIIVSEHLYVYLIRQVSAKILLNS